MTRREKKLKQWHELAMRHPDWACSKRPEHRAMLLRMRQRILGEA